MKEGVCVVYVWCVCERGCERERVREGVCMRG